MPRDDTTAASVGSSDAPATGPSRRRFLAAGTAAGAGALALGVAGGIAWERAAATPHGAPGPEAANGARTVPFYGRHQAGVTARPGAFASFVALDLLPETDRERLRAWMRLLTDDASRLTQGRPALADVEPELAASPAGLTITVGFGPGLVLRAGGEAPSWLRPLPLFSIDRLEERWSGGDALLLVQSDEPLALAHALRMLLKDSRSFASLRWRQDGFRRAYGTAPEATTVRNLFGQVDGTANPAPGTAEFAAAVWAGSDAPAWLHGGTSFVLRRIAMDLDAWDSVDRVAREHVIGRRIDTGAPLTGLAEHDPIDFDAVAASGLPVISSVAHVRRAHVVDPARRIVRLGYSFDEPASAGADTLSDAGLLFGSFQADVDAQFVPIQRALAEADLLNVWTTPVGSAVFAIPPGCEEGGHLGDALLG